MQSRRAVSDWHERKDAERYHKEWFPRVAAIVKPFLTTPIEFKFYMVETTVCEHLEKAMAA